MTNPIFPDEIAPGVYLIQAHTQMLISAKFKGDFFIDEKGQLIFKEL